MYRPRDAHPSVSVSGSRKVCSMPPSCANLSWRRKPPSYTSPDSLAQEYWRATIGWGKQPHNKQHIPGLKLLVTLVPLLTPDPSEFTFQRLVDPQLYSNRCLLLWLSHNKVMILDPDRMLHPYAHRKAEDRVRPTLSQEVYSPEACSVSAS